MDAYKLTVLSQWKMQATNRAERRGLVKTEVPDFEIEQRSELDSKRDELKAQSCPVIDYNFENGVLICPQCMRFLTQDIGYINESSVASIGVKWLL